MLGFFKAAGTLLALLVLLPAWAIRNASVRARFRAELRAAGVPPDAAKTLSARYKIRLRDFKNLRPA